MIRFISNEAQKSDSFIHVYECEHDSTLANALSQLMVSRGYKLIQGTVNSGVYEKGNQTMRLLFGAFSKYFNFKVTVENCKINFSTGTPAILGGIIGINQVQKEVAEISEALKNLQ